MNKVNLIFFNFDKDVPLVAELTKMYSSRDDFEVKVLASADEVNQMLLTSQNGILFFNLGNKKDLQSSVSILKANRKAIRKGLIKPCAITSIQNKKIESLLAKYGCKDLLEPSTKPKTLTFKLDFWSKPIRKHLQKAEAEEQLKIKRASQKNETQGQAEKKDFETVKSLELQSDFWIVKAKADYKKILRRYLIRLLGPSPFVGNWIELEPQPGDKQPTWKWVQKDPDNEDYIVEDGAWFFYGAKPEFDWKISRWSFASDLPHLYFYSREGEAHSRFKIEDGVVQIAENSEFALMREEMILKTCDSKFNIEGDAAESEGSSSLEGEGSEADQIDGTLAGKGSAADRYGDDPVSGKGGAVDELGGALTGKGGAADSYGEDPLSGKGGSADDVTGALSGKGGAADSYGEDPLSGKGSAVDRLGEEPLSGKVGGVDAMGNPVEGKGSAADHYGDDPLSGKTGAVDAMGNPIDGKGSAADHYGDDPLSGKTGGVDAMGNPIDGKGSAADRYGDDPLSGKGGAVDAMGNPLTGEGSAADRMGEDPLAGKASTDAMGNPLTGKGSAADRMGEDPLAGKAGTDAMGNPLTGEGSAADRMGEDPLAGKASTDAMGNPLTGKGSAADRMGEDPLAGKASTDAMGNPLTGEGSAADRMGEDPLAGKASTDAMGNPLTGEGSAADHFGDDPLSGKAGTDAMGNPLDGKGSAADRYGDDPLSGKTGGVDAMGNPIDGKGSAADEFGKDPLAGKINQEMEKPGVVDPSAIPIDPKLVDQLLENAPDISPELKDELKQAQTLADLLPNIENMTPEEIDEALKKMGIDDDILESLNLSQPLIKLKKQKEALAQLPEELQEKLAEAKSIEDLIPNIDQMSAAEIEEAKQNLGIDEAVLQALNLDKEIEQAQAKQAAIESLPDDIQDLAKNANDINDLIPNADQMSPEELAEAMKKMGLDDDILDKLNLRSPVLSNKNKAITDNDFERESVAGQKPGPHAQFGAEGSEEGSDYFNEKKRKQEQLQELSDKAGPENYLEEEKRKKAEAAAKAAEDSKDTGDYFNEKKRQQEEIAKREAELEKEYAAKEAAKNDDELNKHDVDHGSKGSFGEKPSASEKEQELFEALGGGLTDGALMDDVTETEELDGSTVIEGQTSSELVNTESGELKVVLKQKTESGSEINFLCEFEDFYEDEIVVKVPKGSLPVDTEVTAVVTLSYNGSKIEVESIGKVEEIEELSENKETLIINISQIDSSKYETFIKLYEDRQMSIADFLELARGY